MKEKFLALNIYWLFNDLNTYLCSLKLWNLNRFAEFEMNLLICLQEDFIKNYMEVNRMSMEKSRMQVRSEMHHKILRGLAPFFEELNIIQTKI